MIKYLLALLLIFPAMGLADTHYVGKTNAANTGTCTNQATPCATIAYGISQMAGGDTLIVGNGTYTTTNDVIRDPPNGSAGAYTTVQAETDFGVLLDGTSWGNSSWVYGLRLDGRSYVKIQGFRINAAQNDTGGPSFIGSGSHHIKIIKCGFWNGPVDGNGEITGVGDSSGSDANYILFEDCYAFGGSRAGFTAYWSNHVIFRRCIARHGRIITISIFKHLGFATTIAKRLSTKTTLLLTWQAGLRPAHHYKSILLFSLKTKATMNQTLR